jgi:CHAD domain-containing protein
MADGKWIENLKASAPLPEAARQVLFARLQVVRTYLPKALHEADQDAEYVHQLRVATRRADAALRIFGQCLPEKVWQQARRRLRRIRRAAGAARDLDVFALHLLQWQPDRSAREQPGLDYLVGHTLAQRTDAQLELLDTGRRDGHDFDVFVRDLLLAVRAPDGAAADATLLALAPPVLSGLAQALADKAAGDLTDYPHLHAVRIAGKRLRYAMEIFACCFDPPFRQNLYPSVERMQEILGLANDSYVASERLKEIRAYLRSAWPDAWKRLADGIEAQLQFHHKRLPAERRRFVRWWKQWQQKGAAQLDAFLHAEAAV